MHIEKLKSYGIKNIIALLFISLIITSCCFTYINKFVDGFLSYDTLSVTVKDNQGTLANEVWIATDLDKDQFNSLTKKGMWEYRDANTYGYSYNMILSYGTNGGSEIQFNLKKSPTSCLKIWKNINSGSIIVNNRLDGTEYNLHSSVEGGEFYSISPFKNYKLPLLLTLLVILIVLIAIFLIIIYIFTIYQNYSLFENLKYNYKISILCFFLLIYLYDIIEYKTGNIPNFLAFGDQNYYWLKTNFFTNGMLDLKIFALDSDCFRGYICNIAPLISNIFGKILKFDSVYMYYIYIASISAIFIGYIVPKIYELSTENSPKYSQVITFFVIYSIFWRGTYSAILTDLSGIAFLLGSLLMFGISFKNHKYMLSLLSGILLSISISYRPNHVTCFYLLLVILFAMLAIKFLVSKSKSNTALLIINNILYKNLAIHSALFIIGVVLICVPQFFINFYQGELSLFPYDKVGAWTDPELTLLESAVNRGLTNIITAYPYPLVDPQVLHIRTIAGYDPSVALNMNQSLYAYSTSPLDTMVAIFKKLFAMFDVKTNISYPEDTYSSISSFYLFSTLNYIIWAIGLYTLFNKTLRTKLINKNEILCWSILIFIIIAPLTAATPEWRSGLLGYVFIYYVTVFHFMPILKRPEGLRILNESNLLPFICCFVFLAHIVSLSMFS